MRWFVIKNPFLFLKCLIHNHSKISQVKTQVHCQKKMKFNSENVKILQRHLDICLSFNQERRLIWATLVSSVSSLKLWFLWAYFFYLESMFDNHSLYCGAFYLVSLAQVPWYFQVDLHFLHGFSQLSWKTIFGFTTSKL